MSIQKITPDNVEFFSIETNPSKSYSSRFRRNASGAKIYFTGSFGNPEATTDNTGSIGVYAIRSPIEKETIPLGFANRIAYEDQGFEQLRRGILENTSSNILNSIVGYMNAVSEASESLRKQAKLEILRFIPSFNFSSNTIRKNLIVDHLMPFYRTSYPSAHFNYSNYHSLHFFSSSSFDTDFPTPNNSVLMYPNPPGDFIASGVFDSDYGFKENEAFSFDFWIKPKYTVNDGEHYRAGTILHLSGAYAISLVSGSSKDMNGRPDKFRIMLQLGSGSGLPPSQDAIDASSGVYISDDNALEFNRWSHVSICYGGSNYNDGSGSFIINGSKAGVFFVNDPTFATFDSLKDQSPCVLMVGNFYEGPNYLAQFFNLNSATRDGLYLLVSGTTEPPPGYFGFTHPLNAELHDIKIYDKYLTLEDIEELDSSGPSSLDNLKFYVPPFFTVESPFRSFVGTYGGELITPFFERNGTTSTPYAGTMAFGAGGHYPNLENYVRDFATGRFPRLWYLTASAQSPGNDVIQSANAFLYSSGTNAGSTKKRLYTVLPCDHGNWQPSFNLLNNLSGASDGRYSNDLEHTSLSVISLKNIVSGVRDLTTLPIGASGSILDDALGTGPEADNLTKDFGSSLTMVHRLRDNSSNQVAVFDISNIFYGNQIKPKSIVLTDPHLSGSDSRFGMVIRDDGYGNLYRADAYGDHATWASVGNVFYDEGLLLIKHPNLFFFGEEGFDISFRGIQNVHVYTINAYARPLQLVSSSNPSFVKQQANSALKNEPDQRFVYITGLNIHDENLNVIAKSNLAQPIVKKTGDKMLFKFRLDY